MEVGFAKAEDIDGIISVQKRRLLREKKNVGIVKEGFLVYPVSSKELKELLPRENAIILVAKERERVLGYILSYDLNFWRELKPGWYEKLNASEHVKQVLLRKKVLYLRHIARLKGCKGVGTRLLSELMKIAKRRKYEYVICEILESPVKNKTSVNFFEKFGFVPAGSVTYSDGFKWRIFIKKLL